jgi:hypothetical protein
MERVKQLLVKHKCSAKATKQKSPSCPTLLVWILWVANLLPSWTNQQSGKALLVCFIYMQLNTVHVLEILNN